MTLSSSQRHDALRRVEADLHWLILDNRWNRARQILTNGEIQAAVIAAQQYGGTKTGDGDLAWSDPTGNAATSGAATDVRAGQIVKAWLHELEVIRQHIDFLAGAVLALTGETPPSPRRGSGVVPLVRQCTERIAWMLMVPQSRLETAWQRGSDEDRLALDASVSEAADDAQALRSGVLHDGGRRIPGVHLVMESARKAMEAKPVESPPKVRKMAACKVCARWHAPHANPAKAIPGTNGRCETCSNFHRNHGVDRTEAIWKRNECGKGPTPAQMIEARAQKPSRKRKAMTA